ncbi:MAG TPA: hypothetical protein VGE40_14255 [Bacilli bacterium]
MASRKIRFFKIRNVLLCMMVLITLCSNTPPVNKALAIQDTYLFSSGFSSVQGQSQWFYKQWNGTSYSDMAWDASNSRWQGNCSFCLIGSGWAHPDSNDAVIAWKAPKDGVVTIRGTMDHNTLNSSSDGVRTKIMINGSTNNHQVWPSSSGWQYMKSYFTVQHIFQTWVNKDDFLYFHLNQNAGNAYDATDWDPQISYVDTPKFTLDKAVLVMTPPEFDNMGYLYGGDSSISILPNGTNFDIYHSEDHGKRVQKYQGTLGKLGQTSVYVKDPFTNPNNVDGEWWITNMYKTAEGHLLAFTHIENATSNGWWAIGLGYSTDGGNTFTKLGKIVTHNVADTGHNVNIFGVPYVIKDGYFYVYFGENNGGGGHPSAARALVTDVINAAKSGGVTAWKKYYNGAWNEDGINGSSSKVIPSIDSTHDSATHGDAAYSSYLGKYMVSGYTHGPGRGVYLTFSDDGTSYETPTYILHSGDTNKDTLQPYETIVNIDGSDNGVVGRELYVYYSYWFKVSDIVTGRKWYYRQKVELNAAGFNKSKFNAKDDFSSEQGREQWYYFQSNGTSYATMYWSAENSRWQGSNPYTLIMNSKQHPDGNDSVRAWAAPRAGTISITSSGSISVSNGSLADGVKVRVLKNTTNVWPASGWQTVAAGGSVSFPSTTITVAQGDILYFAVNQNINNAYDTTNWIPIITYQ